jgi:hypothetical protein
MTGMGLPQGECAAVPNLMRSWQQAVLLAAGLGAAGVLLVHVGQAAGRAVNVPGRTSARAGNFVSLN